MGRVDGEGRGEVDLTRAAALSDGIFAVAMTLLIVALPLPKSAAELGGVPLRQHLVTLLPALRAIAISFFVAAIFWRAHHGFFRCLGRGDWVLLWLNFLLLFAVTMTPLTAYLLGNFHTEPLTVALYAANLALIGFSLFLMWLRVASRRALLHADVDTARVHRGLWGNGLTTLVFLVSIPVAWLATEAALWMWLLIVPLAALGPRHQTRRRT